MGQVVPVVLISISVIANDPEHLFILSYLSLVKGLFKSFVYLSFGCLSFYIELQELYFACPLQIYVLLISSFTLWLDFSISKQYLLKIKSS